MSTEVIVTALSFIGSVHPRCFEKSGCTNLDPPRNNVYCQIALTSTQRIGTVCKAGLEEAVVMKSQRRWKSTTATSLLRA